MSRSATGNAAPKANADARPTEGVPVRERRPAQSGAPRSAATGRPSATVSRPAPAAGRPSASASPTPDIDPEPAIPVRERRTARRQSARPHREPEDRPVGAAANSFFRRGTPAGWEASADDFTDVNVDPLDPFTATSHRKTTRDGIWDPTGGERDGEDWMPIFGLVGFASLLWLLSVMGNALPTAAPSLGL